MPTFLQRISSILPARVAIAPSPLQDKSSTSWKTARQQIELADVTGQLRDKSDYELQFYFQLLSAPNLRSTSRPFF
jgi:hypothetical protein